jgi:hypothetical protein
MNQNSGLKVPRLRNAADPYWGNLSAGVTYNVMEYAKHRTDGQFEPYELRRSEEALLRSMVQDAVLDALMKARRLLDAAVESAISDFLEEHPEARAARKAS